MGTARDAWFARWSPLIIGLARIAIGLLFLEHGTQKLLGIPPSPFTPPMFSIAWVGGVLEFGGGSLLLVGLLTRPVAFILAGEMAYAYLFVHAKMGAHMPHGFFPVVNGGELAAVYCFAFLLFFAVGAGWFSLDSLWKWSRERRVARDHVSVAV